jgi:hypothetical protein
MDLAIKAWPKQWSTDQLQETIRVLVVVLMVLYIRPHRYGHQSMNFQYFVDLKIDTSITISTI